MVDARRYTKTIQCIPQNPASEFTLRVCLGRTSVLPTKFAGPRDRVKNVTVAAYLNFEMRRWLRCSWR